MGGKKEHTVATLDDKCVDEAKCAAIAGKILTRASLAPFLPLLLEFCRFTLPRPSLSMPPSDRYPTYMPTRSCYDDRHTRDDAVHTGRG